MTTRHDEEEDFDDEWSDDEDDDVYVPCPRCGETMLEAADYCPSCREWISHEDVPSKPRSWWVVGIILILVATLLLSTIGF
jgi:uncharacterized OB-fold protein